MSELGIAELSQKSGVSRRNIYFYVQQGLLRGAIGAGLAAHYREEDLLRLQAIRTFRTSGLKLCEIRERLKRIDVDGLKQVLEEKLELIGEPAATAGNAAAPIASAPETTVRAESVLRYTLSPGVELLVDARAAGSIRPHVVALTRAVKEMLGAGRDREAERRES